MKRRSKISISVSLPIEMVEWLDEESRSRGVPISQIVEEALSLFKEKLCQKGDG
ncbi:MAG: ribbon-helix-helix protein, CopG family [Thermofilaceae archaeon]